MKKDTLIPFDISQDITIHYYLRLDKTNDVLNIKYILEGEIEKIFIPEESKNPSYKHNLWQTTCFELFFSFNKKEYVEWNFSPSKDFFNNYFIDYRISLDNFDPILPLDIIINQSSSRFSLEANIKFKDWTNDTLFQVTAVTEERDSQKKNYWALEHNKEKPDFHKLLYFKKRII